jgi:hypothetical protein
VANLKSSRLRRHGVIPKSRRTSAGRGISRAHTAAQAQLNHHETTVVDEKYLSDSTPLPIIHTPVTIFPYSGDL